MRPPFFHDAINGFVVGAIRAEGVYKSFQYFVFQNIQEAAEFAAEYYKLKQEPSHWDRRTFGSLVNRRSTETQRSVGHYFSTVEEYADRKLFEATFISKIDYLSLKVVMFDSMVTPERIKQVEISVEKGATSHLKEFEGNLVNENKY